MQTLQYLYDEAGIPTAMYVDLKNSRIDNIFKSPLNKPQLEILKLVGSGFNDTDLNELQTILASFLMNKIRRSTNKIWDEKGYSKETFDSVLQK